jgi:hypothetical protein
VANHAASPAKIAAKDEGAKSFLEAHLLLNRQSSFFGLRGAFGARGRVTPETG